MRYFFLFALLVSLNFACTPETPFTYDPPEGWIGDVDRWWKPVDDTSMVFRRLNTLEDMRVVEEGMVYASTIQMAQSSEQVYARFERAVKQSLIQMYRNDPETVDSIFTEVIDPIIGDVQFTRDPAKDVDTFKRKAYRLLSRHYREPRAKLDLGTDVPVVYPDSIREQGISGSVGMQVHLNANGEPQSIELLESVHPVLDAIAMQATTQMLWLPAYTYNKDWIPLPSYTRFRVRFDTVSG